MHTYANGLGPTRWGRWNALLPYRKRFNKAGELHDLEYSLGGKQIDKEEADIQFFQNCLDASGYNIMALAMSIVYFLCVYYFGHFFFTYK